MTEPQFRAEVSDHFVVGRAVSLLHAFQRKLVGHAREVRDARQLFCGREASQQRVLNGLRRNARIGRPAVETRSRLSAPSDTSTLANRHHAASSLWLEHPPTLDSTPAPDLGEIVPENRH
jgi:hypothetical protein